MIFWEKSSEVLFSSFEGPFPPENSAYLRLNLPSPKKSSWPIYVNVDSPNLGFPYFYFLGGYQ